MKKLMLAMAAPLLFSVPSLAAKKFSCQGLTEEQVPVAITVSVDVNDYAEVKFSSADFENSWVGEHTRLYRTIGGMTKLTTALGSRTEYFVKLEVADNGQGTLEYEENDSGWEYFASARVQCTRQ
ncbi:polyketide synthase [Bdellovibrio bacteriovorus]|uniref:polyketide synthase n=1 Tax=Bdellovibrio bacteriovorus TaxID=959 RepID=UPI003AA7AAD0